MKKFLGMLCAVFLVFGVVGVAGATTYGDDRVWISDGDPLTYQLDKPYKKKKKTTPAPVPEPATMILLGTGLIGLGAYGRKKFKK